MAHSSVVGVPKSLMPRVIRPRAVGHSWSMVGPCKDIGPADRFGKPLWALQHGSARRARRK